MQRRFPLLDLPNLPFESVYGYLEFEDLIHLAACSNRLKSVIRIMEERQKKLTNFWFEMPRFDDTNGRFISLNDKSQTQTRKEFRITFSTCPRACSKLLSTNIKVINGEIWYVYQLENGQWLIEKSTECQLFWFKYLKDLFYCRTEFNLKLDNTNLSSETLFLNTCLLHVADVITIHLGQMSAENLTYLLNNLQARKLKLTFKHFPDVKLSDLVIRSRCLTIGSSRFLNLKEVWKMIQGGIYRQLYLYYIEVPSSQDVNQFIENWLDSDNTTFERLTFTRESNEPILLEIPSLPGCKKREDAAEYYNKYTLYEEGQDIRRRDGLLATFAQNPWGQFSFTVWYCFDPNVLTDDNN